MTTSSSAAFHNRVPFGTLIRARIRETDPHDDRSRQSLVERCHVSSDSDQRWCKSSACLDIGTESLVALTIQEWGFAAEQYVVRSKVSVVRRFSRGGCFRHVLGDLLLYVEWEPGGTRYTTKLMATKDLTNTC